ncbi:MAG: acyl carrier protein [Clostridiaceae bacterium]|nr:acyl carrier protein [Clostridiaceae bacterium]MCI9484988.1 acyl carrier protein [Clostridiaceae bacterium]NBH78634.1 acyl carrier protein [Clostridiaceae bacterium]NBI82279.1 acyl carrier protein [Clostridiaceae bacterium]RKJ78173.1 acyl carrier protein [Butyricicoccus sp. 1XD8-22]
MFERLCNILAEQFGVEPETIKPETTFVEDLGADSLDLVELMMSIEEEFDVGEISEQDAAKIKTVGDVLEIIGE